MTGDIPTVRQPTGMVLSVAGSDPSGGAGIQADLKTFTSIGVYGGAVVTCVTVQNTRGVRSFLPLPADLVADQILAVLDDMPVTHIKTGMMGNGSIAEAVGKSLTSFKGEIICDPVLASSDGTALLSHQDIIAFETGLVARATVLTPNLPELEILSGEKCQSEVDISHAAAKLFVLYPRLRVLTVKGGHFMPEADSVIDSMYSRNPSRTAREPSVSHVFHNRVITKNTHGTGCSFASAFAAFHLLHGNDLESFERASTYIHQLLSQSASISLGKGQGPLLHYLFCSGTMDQRAASE
jgi:hydroxymethylpyrimidine/phosphomethylpyrimidine kinase